MIKIKNKPLDRETERAMFKLYKKGSQEARDILLCSNMRYVLSVARSYLSYQIPQDDLVSEGTLGLIRAIDSFDVDRGMKFITYARHWIKAYMSKALRTQTTTIKLPANQFIKIGKELKRTKDGSRMDQEIKTLLMMTRSNITFDSKCRGGNDKSSLKYADILEDKKADNPEKVTDKNDLKIFTDEILSTLNEKEAFVIKSCYGINSEVETIKNIGENMNLSRTKVNQLRDQALRKIRQIHGDKKLREKLEGCI